MIEVLLSKGVGTMCFACIDGEDVRVVMAPPATGGRTVAEPGETPEGERTIVPSGSDADTDGAISGAAAP